jgi:hypothetical protein
MTIFLAANYSELSKSMKASLTPAVFFCRCNDMNIASSVLTNLLHHSADNEFIICLLIILRT